MYPEVKAEFARKGWSYGTVVEELKKVGIKMTRETLSTKMTGKYDFTLDEAKAIKNVTGSELPLDVLFQKKEEAV